MKKRWPVFIAVLACSIATSLGVDVLLRHTRVGLGGVLIFRGGIGFLLLLALERPKLTEIIPSEPRLIGFRLVAAALTFVGWFGAIGELSAAVAAPLLLFDVLVLHALTMRAKGSRDARVPILLLGIICYVALSLRESNLGAHSLHGLLLAALAVVCRAAGYRLWAEANQLGERRVVRIGSALLGSVVAGTLMQPRIQIDSQQTAVLILLVGVFGIGAYLATDKAVSLFGPFRTRLIELTGLPILWLEHVVRYHSGQLNTVIGLLAIGIGLGSAWIVTRPMLHASNG